MTGQIFISQITKGDSRGRQLRRCLVEKVRDRGYTAFVDEEDVSAADMWRSELYVVSLRAMVGRCCSRRMIARCSRR